MSKLTFLVIHCTATPENRVVSKQQVIDWHCAPPPKGHGWRKPGYTDMIHLDGSLENITPFDQDDEVDGYEMTNGVRGKNSISRHIVYVGGCDYKMNPKDTRTPAQTDTLVAYVKYMVKRHPHIKIAGHYMFDSGKACPSFDVACFCEQLGISKNNVYDPNK